MPRRRGRPPLPLTEESRETHERVTDEIYHEYLTLQREGMMEIMAGFYVAAMKSETLAQLFVRDPALSRSATDAAALAWLQKEQPAHALGQGRGGPKFSPTRLLAWRLSIGLQPQLGAEECHRIAAGLAREVLGDDRATTLRIANMLRRRGSELRRRSTPSR